MIRPDLIGHFIAGLIISAIVTLILPDIFYDIHDTAWGVIAASLVGALKEVRDALGRGIVDVSDWLATTLGGITILIVNNLIS